MTESQARVLLETLKLTKEDRLAHSYEVAASSRTTKEFVQETLSDLLARDIGEEVRLAPKERLQLAIASARSSDLMETARALDWREFERFAEECLRRYGYETERNVRLSDGKKRWEIDIVARKPPMMLCLDCKHWAHSSPQRLRDALDHQLKATVSLDRVRKGRLDYSPVWALPIVLTLFDNPLMSNMENGVFVSVARFQDFIGHLTHYDPNMPFIPPSNGQKPIS